VKAGDQPAVKQPFLCSHTRCSASVATASAVSCSASVALASAVKLCRAVDPLAQLQGSKLSTRYGSIGHPAAATYVAAGFQPAAAPHLQHSLGIVLFTACFL